MLEDVARSALRRLAELDHRAKLFLVHRAALLVVLEVGAEIDGREVLPESLPFSAAMLAHQTVTLQQREHDLCLARGNSRQLHDVVEKNRGLERILFQCQSDLRGLL